MIGTCKNCGKALDDTAQFCSNCGTARDEIQNKQSVTILNRLKNSADPSDLRAGVIVDERYEIRNREPDSAFLTVYLVNDKKDLKLKRLKIIPPLLYDHAEAMDFLVEEFKSKFWLNSPHIAQTYSIQTDGPYKYVISEYFKGRTLEELKYAATGHRLPEKLVLNLALQLATALEYAHNYNVLAGSLHLDSILVNKDGVLKIDNFGMREALYNTLSLHLNVSSLRSLAYMAPEHIQGKISSIRTDIYAFGLLLYELLSGHPPFFSGDLQHQILKTPVPDLDTVSTKFNLLIHKCLIKDPSKRYNQLSQVKNEIEVIKKTLPVRETAAVQKPESQKVRKTVISMAGADRQIFKRIHKEIKAINRRYVYALGAVILLLTVIFGVSFLTGGKEPPGISQWKSEDLKAWSQVTPENREEINRLLMHGDSLLKAGNLVEPPEGNAFDQYQEVLTIFPPEKRANQKLSFIKQNFLDLARAEIDQGKFFKAESILLSGLAYYPGDSMLVSLTEKNLKLKHRYMTKQPLDIEILNGAGVSGIARELAEFLQARDYSVVNTENYRVDGNVKWDVQQSFIINRYGHNIHIENLAELLGITNVKLDTISQGPRSSQVIVVLGLDYQSLSGLR